MKCKLIGNNLSLHTGTVYVVCLSKNIYTMRLMLVKYMLYNNWDGLDKRSFIDIYNLTATVKIVI